MGKDKKNQDCAVNCRAVTPVHPGSSEFINPYNFVRVEKPAECDRTSYTKKVDHAKFHDNLNTGKLRCKIKAISPMFIPDMTTKKECKKVEGKWHYEYNLFKINEKPAIPGTSIKGMLRSVYETITNSCFSQISKEEEKINFREGGSKSTFNKNVYNTLENFSEHLLPCRDIQKLCPACKLFGAVDLQGVNTDETVSLAGKIKITNALLNNDSHGRTETVTLKILGSPHETATSFYLINENYDNSSAIIKKTNAGYDQTPQPILRGRKYYWHQCNDKTRLKKSAYEAQAKDKQPKCNNQNATVELLKEGAEFEFDLYFENITKEELALLIWCLELENNMLHKLGHGKPLGLGSIKINIDYENSYLVDIKTRYLDINSDGKTSLKDFKLTSAIECGEVNCRLKFKNNGTEIVAFEIKNRMNYEDLVMILTPHPELFDKIKYPASQATGYKWFSDNSEQQLCTIHETVTEKKTQDGFS
ncbi:MAG: TIGR03986 family CRISPR-associated RAMP protein [Deltaproteobacteria bacterium]|nr:TIGR03986 family CRISPR-associated RAMP protein [Deltaproteobacteria bacterium]